MSKKPSSKASVSGPVKVPKAPPSVTNGDHIPNFITDDQTIETEKSYVTTLPSGTKITNRK